MIINHNIPAMNAHRQLGINNSTISKSLEKLSSGLGINRAADNAAGLAISEKMRGQISGLNQASKNAQDGISLIQTAEGALNETHSILQRMRELSVQSANGTYQDDVDRENIQKEVEALKSEIDRIATSTHFNGKQLLDGSLSAHATGAVTGNAAAMTSKKNAASTATVNGLTVSYASKPAQAAQDTGISSTINLGASSTGTNGVTAAAASATSAVGKVSNAGATLTVALDGTTIGGAAGTGFTAVTDNATAAKKVTELVDREVSIKVDNLTIKFTDGAAAAGISADKSVLTVDISSAKAAAVDDAAKFNTAIADAIESAVNTRSGDLDFVVTAADGTAGPSLGDTAVVIRGKTQDLTVNPTTTVTSKQSDNITVDFSGYDASANKLEAGYSVSLNGKTYEFADDTTTALKNAGAIRVNVGGKDLATASGQELANALETAINGEAVTNGMKAVSDGAAENLVITADSGKIADNTVKWVTSFKNSTPDTIETKIDLANNLDKGTKLSINGKDYTMTDAVNDPSKEIAIGVSAADTAKNIANALAKDNTLKVSYTAANTNLTFSRVDGTTAAKAEATGKATNANRTYTITSANLKAGDTFTYEGKTVELVNTGDSAKTANAIALDVNGADATKIKDTFFNALAADGTATSQKAALALSVSGTDKIVVDGDTADTAKLTTNSTAVAGIATANEGLIFQIGANGTADQRVELNVENMSSATIGTLTAKKDTAGNDVVDANGNVVKEVKSDDSINSISVATRKQANDAIKVIDDAINQVSGTRADLGALQNRMEHTINSLGVASENLTASESRIRDVDMAKEMMNFTKNQILSQASQAMLAQANTLPQGVLQLLQ